MSQKLHEARPDQSLMCLFKGRPKTRKSTGAASFPGPIYFFDFDNRMKGIQRHFKDREDIEYDFYGSSNFAAFKHKMESFQLDCPYKTLVIDSLTMLCTSAIWYFVGARG